MSAPKTGCAEIVRPASASVFQASIELAQSQTRHREMSQRDIGDITLGVGRQVSLERGDGFGVSPGGQVRLADQELGIRGDRSASLLGQTGENRIGQRGLPQGPVRKGQLVAGGLVQGGRQRGAGFLAASAGGVDE